MRQVVQIVPRISPSQDGVGDYALILARELRASHDIDTLFLIGNPTQRSGREIDGFLIEYLGARREVGLVELLVKHAANPVLLNYVGPGYDRNSCPFWLLRGLRVWKQEVPQGHLITMFHELYSEGPPWTRAFWTNPFQRQIAAGIARLSDVVRTNVGVMERRLERMVPALKGKVDCVPVFSNVGETEDS